MRFWNKRSKSITIPTMNSNGSESDYTLRQEKIISALVSARKEAGVSQAEIAAAIGLNQPDISKIESGERRLDVIEFLQFVEYLTERTKKKNLLEILVAASSLGND